MNILDKLTQRINKCSEEVDNRNRDNLLLLSRGALLLASIIVCLSLALSYYRWLALPHVMLFFYSILMFFVAKRCQKKCYKHIRLMQYLLFAPLLLGGVLVGSVFDPTRQGVTVIIFICILPLFIIDNPWRMIAYQLVFAGLFVVCAYYSKPHEVFMADMLYFPVYLAYIIGANIFCLMDKVASVENYLLACKAAERDVLTDLLNRSTGETRIETLLKQGVCGSFAILDIDNFKDFNDLYGHQTGDAVLCEVSNAMHSVFRSSDILWRLGGDEFAVYAVDLVNTDICKQRFAKLMTRLKNIVLPDKAPLCVKVSIGCIIDKQGAMNFTQLYKMSDEALYEVKNTGKGILLIKEN